MTEQTFGGYASDPIAPRISTASLDELAGPSPAEGPGLSLLDELEAELAAETENVVRFPVSMREGWVLEFNAVIGSPQIKRYNDTAKGKGKAENADARISNGMALIEANTGIFKERDGELVKLTDPEGRDLKLNSTRWLQMMKEPIPGADTIRALCRFLGDAGVITMGSALLRAAGWAEDLTPLDPTNG
ncbi:tail assembly chaperone [Arthrobacter phage Altadena]|uniref:Tail assembly chaperone n=1 Tax=Arthrobacter phage Altadena TaxID=3059064 RepID=A0AA96HT68_9CAUD|nr:tail assembly chaperone [Arthrobacter phage Altadena]